MWPVAAATCWFTLRERLQLGEWLLDLQPRYYSKFTMELVATMMFHFIGSVSPTAWANSIALMVLVYYSAKTSGAHLNPALSLTFMLLGHTTPYELVMYWIAQVAGAVFGALWLACLVPGLAVGASPVPTLHHGCFVPRSDLTGAQVFGWEAVCTFAFAVPVFSVVWYTTHKKGYGNTGPIMIGLSLLASAFAAGPYTGAALNPARVLGSSIVFDCEKRSYAGYYIGGEMLAAAVVPLFIVPWYGINSKAWYISWVPDWIRGRMRSRGHAAPSINLSMAATNNFIRSP